MRESRALSAKNPVTFRGEGPALTGTEPQIVTRLLAAVSAGEPGAADQLLRIVYQELRTMASRKMARESPGHTLQATALVHEAYVRLFGGQEIHWQNRRHFFGASAKAMERILVEHARHKGALKERGGRRKVPLEHAEACFGHDPAEVLTVSDALAKLEQIDRRKAEVVRLRYFLGLTVDEAAESLGVSPRTVDFEWKFARTWLHRELTKDDTGGGIRGR